MSEYQLPTLAELHYDPVVAFKNDQLSFLLHQPPHNDWVKQHPTIKVKDDGNAWVKLKYIPIDKIEYLLTRIF